ncbi:MAG: B12-binding domain-containing radical SAM protein [Anaerohalosphaera sp.]|nr:B12-binding domain-containing radical SAM protein [Anaerohalosphaera sp.]
MKIGLIAMSGIRCCDSELLEMGLTLPGFVERSKTVASLPSLGLLTLAGMTGSEHEVDYIEMPDMSGLENVNRDYDLIGISSYSAQIAEAYEVGRYFRGLGIPVVIGGPHVTALPDEALEHCDSVVIGQGEIVWQEVVNDCKAGRLAKKYGSRRSEYDLADGPMPAFEMLDISNYNRLTVQTSRGCPHRCGFCASSVMLTDKYLQKPVSKVLAEIDRIKEIWEHPFIEFADDNSFVNKSYWKELLPALARRHVKWFTESDLSVTDDEELLGMMHRSGCAQVLIGFESPVREALCGVDIKSNWKYKRFDEYAGAIERMQSHGVTVNGCFVIGLDGHTTDIFDQVYDFVRQTELYEVQVTILTPFPGTVLYEKLKSEGRLIEEDNWKKCTLFDVNYVPSDMTVEELNKGFKGLVSKLYCDEFTSWRRNRFKEKLRQSHRIGY